MTSRRLPRRSLPLRALAAAMALLACLALGAAGAAGSSSKPRAHAAASYMTGIGDEQTRGCSANPLWTQLHTRIARYIAPYDAAVHPDSLARARAWITAAEAKHIQVLVAFYHSEHTPTRLPSVAQYKHDVQKFVKLLPVRQAVPVLRRGQPRQRAGRVLEPLRVDRGGLLPGAAAGVHALHRDRARRARRAEHRPDAHATSPNSSARSAACGR